MTYNTIIVDVSPKSTAPIPFDRLKQGDIFQYRDLGNMTWCDDAYMMLNPNTPGTSGQVVQLRTGMVLWIKSAKFVRIFRTLMVSAITDSVFDL